MATQENIDKLRLLLGNPSEDELSDVQLGAILDGVEDNLNLAAAEGWGIRAASYSSLVNVSESGSSRQLGELYKNALAMQAHYAGQISGPAVTAGRTRIGRIVRRDE